MLRNLLLASAVLLCGCSTHPITGRDQILVLPPVQAAYADAGFALSLTAHRLAGTLACERDCGSAEDAARLAVRVEAIGKKLEAAARGLSPELFERIGGFRIEVEEGQGDTQSSAGGRIVLGAEIAALEPTDTVLAFLLAREMAHVIARHAEENSGASVVFSALGLLLPGFNVMVRLIAGKLGPDALRVSWAAEQQREADEIALALLARVGVSPLAVAQSLENGVRRERLPDNDWGAHYLESKQRAEMIAQESLHEPAVTDDQRLPGQRAARE